MVRTAFTYRHEVAASWPMTDPGSATRPPIYAPPKPLTDDERQRVMVTAISIRGEVAVHRDHAGRAQLEGVGVPAYVIELGVAGRERGKRGPLSDWTVYAHMRNAHGDWVVDALEFRCEGEPAEPSARLRAAVSPERWRDQVDDELRARMDFEWGFSGDWRTDAAQARKIVLDDWGVTAPRSPRGPLPTVSIEDKRANRSTVRSRRRRVLARKLV